VSTTCGGGGLRNGVDEEDTEDAIEEATPNACPRTRTVSTTRSRGRDRLPEVGAQPAQARVHALVGAQALSIRSTPLLLRQLRVDA
jgi:hypothetical protein